MRYIPNTPDDRSAMLRDIGVSSLEELLEPIPAELRLNRPLAIADGKSEWDVRREVMELAALNQSAMNRACFMGAGSYDHYVPAAVDALGMRSEYVTAYTPYQPEVAQGTLQVIYEFQSMVCELYAMPAANASLYDCGTALSEAISMARAHTKRTRVVWSEAVNPAYRRVAETNNVALGIKFDCARCPDGSQSHEALSMLLGDDVAALVVQYPNFFGVVDDVRKLVARAHSNGTLVIFVTDPMAMGVLTPPGKLGADIVVGEGQPLGNYMSFGGPYLGLFAASNELIRLMPGRIVGVTKDVDGRRGYVLTLQTREQHIRRDKATSNICTNQGLLAARATFYMSMMGPTGLREIGEASARRTMYMMDKLRSVAGFSLPHRGPHFREFLMTVPGSAEEFVIYMAARGILAGVPLTRMGLSDDRGILVALTEKRSVAEIDAYVEHAATWLQGGAK
ncbi:MAG: aminomethyl-transferring glycine dehydrogenase subunit GcvPA [bacterium]|nr:aminomethyl-transferring glycine dehydrogenase subunit GcvPA [bacterium]MBK8130418.1 aminomethyl-transferring glycine dehydrogenase subunit GcvPA [bacterium]